MDLTFRPFTVTDYEAVTGLWHRAGIKLTLSDSRHEIARMLDRNPDTCFLASCGDAIIGVVMGSWDGRRGFVHHLAVEPASQRSGVGSAIMAELERRFRVMGVVKMSFLIEQDNTAVVAFYRKLGYELREDLIVMSKALRTT